MVDVLSAVVVDIVGVQSSCSIIVVALVAAVAVADIDVVDVGRIGTSYTSGRMTALPAADDTIDVDAFL